jgi:hypothetical protein
MGGVMISAHHEINEFIRNVGNRDKNSLILDAIDEATEAERLCLKNSRANAAANKKCQSYALQLKKLVLYLRYGVRSADLPEDAIELLKRGLPAVSDRSAC